MKQNLTSKTALATYAITILVTIALIKGINGMLTASALALLAGLGGYAIGFTKGKK